MKKFFFAVLVIVLTLSCNNSEKKSIKEINSKENSAESAQELEDLYKKQQNVKELDCVFNDPDSSVIGIKSRNLESTLNVLGKRTNLVGDSTHLFYSHDKKEQLALTVHAGDLYNQISIFKISYSKDSKQSFRELNVSKFQSEKGIMLGMNKTAIIERLGTCFVEKENSEYNVELHYAIKLPDDTTKKFLTNHKMPSYFAIYKFKKHRLYEIEFGFEYP